MPYREITGNLFASEADALVNTVNCVGFMGKGVALEFRRRFPEMFKEYKQVCERGELRPGQILPYRKCTPSVLNFAVKNDWKHPSKIEWIDTSLQKFCEWYPSHGLRSVAFPWMGAMNGGIHLSEIQGLTRKYLEPLTDIDVEVYTFDEAATDPLFENLSKLCDGMDVKSFHEKSCIQLHRCEELYRLMEHPGTTSLTAIVESGIMGKTSIDRLYGFLVECQQTKFCDKLNQLRPSQMDLFGTKNHGVEAIS
jgi:O-acetyl-ADP-ribose deacetylase (regulator of RNase III)